MKTILIVDDEVVVREVLTLTLGIGEFRVLQAENAIDAINMAKVEKPHLIIMDLVMPGGMDGLEATNIIKNDPETKDCQVLILTGKSRREDLERGLEAGAAGYFIKPFSPLKLIKKIEELLQ